MPIYSADVAIQCFLRYGFDHLIAHPEELDEIFANFKADPLWKQYGEKEIDSIKQWISTNEIPIVLAWSLNPSKVPCISVQIAQSTELVEAAGMDDFLLYEEVPKLNDVILEFIPMGLTEEGDEWLVWTPKGLDYAMVRAGFSLVDSKGEEYLITRLCDKGIYVDKEGNPINPTNLVKVKSSIKTDVCKRHQAAIQESIDIGIHGHADQNTVLWLYYMTIWIFLRFKPELEKRCLDLSTFSASDFNRESQYIGENVFSRYIRVTARSMITWVDPPEQQIDTIVATVDPVGEND